MLATVVMDTSVTKRIAAGQDETYRETCDLAEMDEPFQRLAKIRAFRGHADATTAARAFGWNDTTYRAHEAGGRGLRRDVAEKYASAFRVPVEWLLFGVGEDPTEDASSKGEVSLAAVRAIAIPVVGPVEAGTFREVIGYDDDEPEYVFDEQDPEFPNARMTAFDVHGDSMNEAEPPIMPGARVVCVNFDDTGLPLSDGMIVVVERTDVRNGRREWSIKEVETVEDGTKFLPRSSNKSHKPFTFFDNPDDNGGERVEILGLVRSVIYGVASGRRRNPRKRY